MTWIMLNPDELTTTAEVLRQAASDLGELVSQVYAACCSCCGPPAVDASIAELGAWIRSSVGGIEGGLRVDAAGLDTSATVMANDASLVSAIAAAWGGAFAANSPAGGLTGSWLDSMDTPVVDPGGWIDSDSWIDGIISGTTPVGGGGYTGFGPQWEAEMQRSNDVMVANILALVGQGGGSGGGMSVAGIGGSTFVPTLSQIQAGSANSMHNWYTGNYVSEISDGTFNGSREDWLKYNGYNMSDPLVGMYS